MITLDSQSVSATAEELGLMGKALPAGKLILSSTNASDTRPITIIGTASESVTLVGGLAETNNSYQELRFISGASGTGDISIYTQGSASAANIVMPCDDVPWLSGVKVGLSGQTKTYRFVPVATATPAVSKAVEIAVPAPTVEQPYTGLASKFFDLFTNSPSLSSASGDTLTYTWDSFRRYHFTVDGVGEHTAPVAGLYGGATLGNELGTAIAILSTDDQDDIGPKIAAVLGGSGSGWSAAYSDGIITLTASSTGYRRGPFSNATGFAISTDTEGVSATNTSYNDVLIEATPELTAANLVTAMAGHPHLNASIINSSSVISVVDKLRIARSTPYINVSSNPTNGGAICSDFSAGANGLLVAIFEGNREVLEINFLVDDPDFSSAPAYYPNTKWISEWVTMSMNQSSGSTFYIKYQGVTATDEDVVFSYQLKLTGVDEIFEGSTVETATIEDTDEHLLMISVPEASENIRLTIDNSANSGSIKLFAGLVTNR
jgi:hypothetical protein